MPEPENKGKESSYDIFLKKLEELESKISEQDKLISEVTEFNRSLISVKKPTTSSDSSASKASDKLAAFLKE